MRLQDLKAIASHVEVWWSDPGLRAIMPGEHACIDALVKLARRVADLYEKCDGWGGTDCLGSDCYKCEGSLIVATPLARRVAHDPLTLYRYLFGEDT